jgi:glycosyltransferase involved in cell wall biosynthesis
MGGGGIINIITHKYTRKNILMVSSLKKYKGVDMFVSLARKCSAYSFSLVISSSLDKIQEYFLHTQIPDNLKIIPTQTDVTGYYYDASIVVNLSVHDLWVETFGMTLIEGFEFGTPCIAPDFGGPREVVECGKNGFLVDTDNEELIFDVIAFMLDSMDRYAEFVKNVFELKNKFSIDLMTRSLVKELRILYGKNKRYNKT